MKILKKIAGKVHYGIRLGRVIIRKITKKIILPGFYGYSLYDVGVFFVRGLRRGAITIRAASIAFHLFIAIFPGLIFLFSLIPYVPVENFHVQLLDALASILPDSVFNLLQETIVDTIMVQRGSTLSIGLILMLFFSSNGVISMIEAFNATYYDIDTRNIISQRITAVALVIILSILIIVAISLMSIGNTLFLKLLLQNPEMYDFMINYSLLVLKWIIIIGLFFLAISFLFYLAPSKKSRFRFITPGGIFATFLIIVSGLAFTYYINNFALYNKLYGSIGTIIIIMLLFYFAALAMILGFELNVSILKKYEEEKNDTE